MNVPATPSPDGTAEAAPALVAGLEALLGAEAVETDEEERRFAVQDLFFKGALPLAVVSPGSTREVSELVRWCAKQAVAIAPRGGGMSYTDAFQPRVHRSVVLGFSRLAAIRSIDPADGNVTVEAGCTWAALDAALAKVGMRARFWGPMSGAAATIGGSLSQGSVTFGSGVAGASANAVKSFEIVTGTGEVLHTGSDGSAGTGPFNRNFGPDFTGLFANDAGALGIKTAATIEIEPRPERVDGISFAVDSFRVMADLLRDVRLRRLASEIIAMDAEVARQNAGPSSLSEDAKALIRIARSAGSAPAGLARMARIAAAGRRFLDGARYTVHFVVEGRDRRELRSRLAAIRGLAKGAREIVNTVPLAVRAAPFPELPVTHPDGRRLLPIHGVFADSRIAAFHTDYLALKAEHAARMAQAGVTLAEFFAGVAGVGTLYEPVFYWPDSAMLYHRRRTPAYLDGVAKDHPDNPAARALVREMVGAIIALMRAHGATHFQIGRLYPYAETREGEAGRLLRDLKQRLDPHGILNPGTLGL
ncbi:FAD-binding oxidoreductase [Erythrobacter sp. HL-111]|uniref:FAD-binding oxidoreductase n=1 Tax=Erythrobacter sp. HL-111 TaxID=1798193 RepID=UPI0006D99BC3|nr:FAD-binding oxidoreductase [Erythrobacter sp. HL-111]KPP96293.1 MAG: glycolate oxidase [Erythrobacteraceae bacterium HL-111]SDR74474.1 D-lactate dehydrogenase (cytochrome) [Erythrobacter sp. HL-111]